MILLIFPFDMAQQHIVSRHGFFFRFDPSLSRTAKSLDRGCRMSNVNLFPCAKLTRRCSFVNNGFRPRFDLASSRWGTHRQLKTALRRNQGQSLSAGQGTAGRDETSCMVVCRQATPKKSVRVSFLQRICSSTSSP